MITINGTIERIIFRNEENGYTVALVNSENTDLIAVGECVIEPKENMTYCFTGDFTYHKKYGEQFSFSSLKEFIPNNKKGIIKYLSSGLIPNIGEKMAERIYDAFGDDALKIIDESPERLMEIEGIGKKKLEKIKSAFAEDKSLRDLVVFLDKYDIGTNLVLKIYKEYGDSAKDIIISNPYRLVEDISGIGFDKADRIAEIMGYEKNSIFRKEAALKYILSMASMEGHSFLPKEELIKATSKLTKITKEELDMEVSRLAFDDKFYIEKYNDEINCYYAPLLRAENYIAGKIIELNKYKFVTDFKVDKYLKKVEKKHKIMLAEKQKMAVEQSIKNGVLVITGGPGTGKTTTLKAIIDVFEHLEKKILLAAPTGRAAKRMKEATGRDASTIHRMLEIGITDEQINYGYEEINALECDVLIVDEMSMVNLSIMNILLKSINPGTRLILVGDKDQLPSVGAGNVLKDLIESETVKVVNLDEIFRQSEESMIIKNSHLINKGIFPEFKKNSDFFFIYENNENNVLELVKDLVKRRLPEYYGFSSDEIQVLAPMRKGIAGVNNLNKNLQEVLNKKKSEEDEIKIGEKTFRINDKVMQIKNNYNLKYKLDSEIYEEEGEGVFNGDIGYITEIDKIDKEVTVIYDDIKEIKYEYSDLDELTLAYATTIHKSQGSEFRCVVIPLTFAPYMLLTRNLLYTAITRAKELVVIVGDFKYLEVMIKNNYVNKRYTNLARKLRDANV